MKITRIRSRKGDSARVSVHLDSGVRMAIATEVAVKAGLREGIELDERELAALERENLAWRVREAALRLLGVRPRSRLELRQRLARRFPVELIEACLDQLATARLLDDLEFARLFACERVRSRPRSRARLLHELRQRGIEGPDAEAAVREALAEAGTNDVELARRAAAKFRPRRGEDENRARRRLHAYLARRGFGFEALDEVVREYDFGTDGSGRQRLEC